MNRIDVDRTKATIDAPPVTRILAEYALSNLEDLDEAWRRMTERAFLDTVAVAYAGASDAAVGSVTKAMLPTQPRGDSGTFVGKLTTPEAAALINGVAAHALDLDDSLYEMYGHPSAVLVPALLATFGAQQSGLELLEAYYVGLRIDIALAAGMDVQRHFAFGWHSSSTIGILGAVAAISRLRRLDVVTTQHALAIAASMASGSLQNFGTATKALHLGLAASNAVRAVDLAVHGVTGAVDQLEGPRGYLAMYSAQSNPLAVVENISAPIGSVSDGINIKRFASCYATHCAAEATLELAPRIGSREVVSIDVSVQPGALVPLIDHLPTTGVESRFSMEYVVAACIYDKQLTLESFEDSMVGRDAIHRLMVRCRTEETSQPPVGATDWKRHFAVVRIGLGGGHELSARCDAPVGHVYRPISDAALGDKVRECLRFSGAAGHADELIERMLNLRDESGRAIFQVIFGLSDGQHR